MTATERQRLLKARRIEAGMVQLNMWVPASAVADFQRAAELIRDDPALAVARLVDTRTGKLKGLK